MQRNTKSLFETEETKIINIKHGDLYDVYIGRPSIWGNPFSHKLGTAAKFKVDSIEEAILKYREYVLSSQHLMEKLESLKGKTLGCWCMPKNPEFGKLYCHGQVLIELIDEFCS